MHSRTSSTRAAGAIVAHLTRDSRKTVLAVGLLTLMAFMWVRVLIGRKPAAAGAAPKAGQDQTQSDEPATKLRLIELPGIPGRTDTIHSDFFVIHDRAHFQKETARDANAATEVQTSSQDRAEEVIRRAVQKLKVEAVLRSDNPQAFVNDRLLSVGDKLTIKEGTESLEFEVREIHADAVLVECNGVRLTLKLAQSLEGRD